MPAFKPFNKIPRLNRECVISEKIDGTNAQIHIEYLPKPHHESNVEIKVDPNMLDYFYSSDGSAWGIWAGSRNRWLTLEEDNFNFAKWVQRNRHELIKLGPGTHYGEWWGSGIQRRYGLNEKRFSLFNSDRWYKPYVAMMEGDEKIFPKCCEVVPVLYRGLFDTDAVKTQIEFLKTSGSHAAHGFMDPEGVVVHLYASQEFYKVTCKNDEAHKGEVE